MALQFKLVDTWKDGKRLHICGTVTASGNYVPGGDSLSLGVSGLPDELCGTGWMDGISGFDYVYVPGPGAQGAVRIYGQKYLDLKYPEILDGEYPEAIRNDTITFYGIFKLNADARLDLKDAEPPELTKLRAELASQAAKIEAVRADGFRAGIEASIRLLTAALES